MYKSLFSIVFCSLSVLTFGRAALPDGFTLFSGETYDGTTITNASLGALCGTEGVICDQSDNIIIINGRELPDGVKSFSDLLYMPQLKSLEMNNMDLTMLFPTEICTLEHLQYLDLSSNNFVGTIPPCICNLAYLKYLNLSNNRFQGGLPTCANGMNSLEEANLSCNLMDEELPESLNYISTLSEINYQCNDFKVYQENITVPNYLAGDINCEKCVKHEGTCPDELYQYGNGVYKAIPENDIEEQELK